MKFFEVSVLQGIVQHCIVLFFFFFPLGTDLISVPLFAVHIGPVLVSELIYLNQIKAPVGIQLFLKALIVLKNIKSIFQLLCIIHTSCFELAV